MGKSAAMINSFIMIIFHQLDQSFGIFDTINNGISKNFQLKSD